MLKLLDIVDEFTREALAIHVARRIDADQTVNVLDELARQRGAPALRDWCRFRRAGTAFIEPGSPWQNAYVESFNGRLRDELLDVEQFSCLAEAVVVIEGWRQDYNAHRPHSALDNQAPNVFASAWRLRTAEPATHAPISP
jgi:putative transposase